MSLDQRLADAARHLADQVDPPEVDLEVVRSRAHANRRRTVALAVAAALVVMGLAGTSLLATGRDTSAPRPARSPTSGIIQTLGDATCTLGSGCLQPGTYSIDLGQDTNGRPLRATVAVREDGWESNGFLHRVERQGGTGAVVLNVYRPYELAGPEPCDAEGASTAVARDTTADDVARILSSLEQFVVQDGPRPLRAFGRDARYLEVRADRLSCPAVEGAQYNLADIYGGDGLAVGGDSDIDPDRPVSIRFWVVELDGKVIVVEARQEGSPEKAAIQALDQVRDSLVFVGR